MMVTIRAMKTYSSAQNIECFDSIRIATRND
jgi:hypothetical protein